LAGRSRKKAAVRAVADASRMVDDQGSLPPRDGSLHMHKCHCSSADRKLCLYHTHLALQICRGLWETSVTVPIAGGLWLVCCTPNCVLQGWLLLLGCTVADDMTQRRLKKSNTVFRLAGASLCFPGLPVCHGAIPSVRCTLADILSLCNVLQGIG
jgi:hypothetical protein